MKIEKIKKIDEEFVLWNGSDSTNGSSHLKGAFVIDFKGIREVGGVVYSNPAFLVLFFSWVNGRAQEEKIFVFSQEGSSKYGLSFEIKKILLEEEEEKEVVAEIKKLFNIK